MGGINHKILTVALCLVLVMTESAEAAEGICYGEGSMAGAILGTFFVTLLLVASGLLFYHYYWKNKKDKRLVLAGDPENVKDEFAFDNPGFKAAEGGAISRPSGWLKLNTSVDKPIANHDGKTFLDDTFPENNRGSTVVPLWSKDFTGLGFEVSGSMRDGIYVSRVLRGGPAYESEKIHTGDRINSVRISFRNMVYEDALSILSFASPYELQLEIQSPSHNTSNFKDVQSRLTAILSGHSNIQRSPGSTLQMSNERTKKIPGYDSLDKNWKSGIDEVKHPILGIRRPRCNSYGDASTLEKSLRYSYLPQPPASPNSTFDTSNQTKNTSLKKILTDKIITSTMEKNKPPIYQAPREQKHNQLSTLDRENEKNARNKISNDVNLEHDVRNKTNDHDAIHKPERSRFKGSNDGHSVVGGIMGSSPPDVIIIKDGGDMYSVKNEKSETQKREPDVGKKGMKFGIRVLPPNIPDDATINMNSRNSKYDLKIGSENGNIVTEIQSIDEVDKKINISSEKTIESPIEVKDRPKSIPVVAKRREKPVAPIPNARVQSQINSLSHSDMNGQVKAPPESLENLLLNRNDELNSSGIKRDAQGIPQEMPQHMMEAAMCARNYRKTIADNSSNDTMNISVDFKKAESTSNKDSMSNKNSKKSKGKAPSPPELSMSKFKDEDDSSTEKLIFSDESINITKNGINYSNDMNFTDNFGEDTIDKSFAIRNSTTHDTNKSDDMILKNSLLNTSTPKAEKVIKRTKPPIPELNDESLGYDIKQMKPKELSDSMNNFFDDSRSNVSSNFDGNSVISFGQDSASSTQNSELEKSKNSSTMIELNSSDITIHSSPVNDAECQAQDDNERKASSLGDLSRLETAEKNIVNKNKISQGTLERAQSLDISSEETQTSEKNMSGKKRKSNSVFDGSYFDDTIDNVPLTSNESVNQILVHSKEPRLSLDISNVSSMDGLNTFQKNRLKKSTEWGNLEDIVLRRENAGSSNSGSSEIANSVENLSESIVNNNRDILTKVLEEENSKLNLEINKLKQLSGYESNDAAIEVDSVPAIRQFELNNDISQDVSKNNSAVTSPITESHSNRKPDVPVRNKIPAESNSNSKLNFEIGTYVTDSSIIKHKANANALNSGQISPKLEEKLTMIYDTNIPDDIKVSRHSLVSSLERPKSDLMKKLLAQNPVLTTNIEPSASPASRVDSENETAAFNKSVSLTNPDVCNDRSVDARMNLTTLTLLNQPDIVNLRIKNASDDQNENGLHNSESDFVSSINIIGGNAKDEESKLNLHVEGSSPTSPDKMTTRNFFSNNENIVTITTDGSQPSSIITIEGDSQIQSVVESFRNSIEVNADVKNNDADAISSSSEQNNDISALEANTTLSSSKTYFSNFANTTDTINTFTTVSKTETVTVNRTEDDLANINVIKSVENDPIKTEEIDLSYNIDDRKRIVENTVVFESETVLSSRHIFNEIPQTQKISQFSEVVVNDSLSKDKSDANDRLLITNTSYKFITEDHKDKSPVKLFKNIDTNELEQIKSIETIIHNTISDSSDAFRNSADSEDAAEDFITEIEVSTNVSSKNFDNESKYVDDFLSNERSFSSDEKDDSDKYAHRRSISPVMMRNGGKESENDDQKMRHSDYDLPRNTHIKFRTSTYEPPNPLPNRLSLTSEKRMSQIEILKSNFEKSTMENLANSNKPSISTKPSNIPIKLPEKGASPPKTSAVVSPSKIPVLNNQNQKSVSQENLLEKSPLQKTSPNFKLSTSTGNITITSIKSSSRNPSGK